MKRPAPITTDDAKVYWDGCRNHKLLLQQCKECACIQFPHRVVCTSCGSRNLSIVEASGRGVVYSYTVVERAPAPEFQESIPYIVGLVDLEEGPRMMTNLICGAEEARIGMAVTVDFDDDNEHVFPVFQPAIP